MCNSTRKKIVYTYTYLINTTHTQLGDLYGNDQLGTELSLDYWCVSEGANHGGRKHHSNHKQVSRSSTCPSRSLLTCTHVEWLSTLDLVALAWIARRAISLSGLFVCGGLLE